MIMKAILGRKSFDIIIKDVPLRKMGNNDVIVRVNACGVCGTDVHFLSDAESEYIPLGHEICAEVVDAGKHVHNVIVGDKVIVEDVAYCGVCEMCKNGNICLCQSGHTLHGQAGMSEYLCVHHSMLNKAEELSDLEACLVEPLAVAINTCFAANLPVCGTLAIIGTGPIALLCASIARTFGAEKVVMIARTNKAAKDQVRLQVADKLGVDKVFFSQSDDIGSEVKAYCENGVDSVIITSPPSTISLALDILKYGGTAVPIGITLGGKSVVNIDINGLIFNKHIIAPVLAEPAIRFPMSIKLLKNKAVCASDIITHTFGFENAKEILKLTRDHNTPMIKAAFINKIDH